AVATSAEVQALVERMGSEMKPGQIIAWKPLVRAGASIAAIEYWTAPGKPASHPTDAEYVIVIAGSGTLISGGVIVDAHVTNPHLTEGSRIEGATTQPIKAGDVLMIGAGVPHYFGVDGGKLALLGIKLPLPSTTPTP
ncbi:MAG TPA: cupin domain-containing protein, partial [Sphingomonas sp.]|nr:cupin domain-containing protein [Sphingomonas sp.]